MFARGVAVGIRSDPAVVLHRSVQRIGTIADVVSQPSRVENGVALGELGIPVFEQRMPIFAKGNHQPLVNFHRDVWLQAHLFRQQVVWLARRLLALGIQGAIKAVAVGRKGHALDAFQIKEVVRLLR